MIHWRTVAVIGSLAVVFALLSLSVNAVTSFAGGGEVGYTLTQSDETPVFLEAVTVDKIAARQDPAYFVVHDAYHPDVRIVVLCRPPIELRSGDTVAIEGIVGSLSNSERCIIKPTVYGYFDGKGRQIRWLPPFTINLFLNKAPLEIPSSPVPPSDPSLPATGKGLQGDVTSDSAPLPFSVMSVLSLLGSCPTVLTPVELGCRPVRSIGDGFIVVGDDDSDATVKVFTNVEVSPTDRIIKLTGTAHTEGGIPVLYADAGPAPYFDPQGFVGNVLAAGIGTTAYAATLSDPTDSEPGGMELMSVSPPGTSDGNWVYLTGQVITWVGSYYSYQLSNNVNIYNIQGLDRTPGIRVWNTGYPYPSVGSIVDVMAKLDTKDGQRLLGTYPYDYSSVECSILDAAGVLLPGSTGLNNRWLGGKTMGNNPGITNGFGLYNIGSLVRVWGRVLETGTYQFDQNGWYTTPYMRIDDGSLVPSGGSGGNTGVIVLGNNYYEDWTPVAEDDYISVTGISSVWKPNGSTDTYRCIWTSDSIQKQEDPEFTVTREATSTGSISGTVTLYDMPTDLPNNQAIVKVYCSNGRMTTLTVTRQLDGTGSEDYTFTNLPKDVVVTEHYEWGDIPNYICPQYIISAQCDGFKTRTYTSIAPGNPNATERNVYVVPLRKIYLQADTYSITPCVNGDDDANIQATVRDSNHDPISGQTVRFWTDIGTFLAGSAVPVHETTAVTNQNGIAAVTLYAIPEEWGFATVWATDDLTTPVPDQMAGDPYDFDWICLDSQIQINAPDPNWTLTLTVVPYWTLPGGRVVVTAKLMNGTTPVVGQSITLMADQGLFDNDQMIYTANTDANGEITTGLTVGLQYPSTATVTASTTGPAPCSASYLVAKEVKVVSQNPTTPVEIFFCLDCTGSMDAEGEHRATASVEKFLNDLKTMGVNFKLGGVKFNEPGEIYPYEVIDVANQFKSLNNFTTVNNFISGYVNNGYSPNGGDWPELQLDALHLAVEDMSEYSTPGNPNRYIVLITDYWFHQNEGGSEVTKGQVINELTASGCSVYISLWEESEFSTYLRDNWYCGLNVNGGEFDPANYELSAEIKDKYPLANLRDRIIANWPSD